MARLVVPPMESRLCALLQPILDSKRLGNDALWRSEINPLLCKFLEHIGQSVRQSATINANAPNGKAFDDIYRTLAEIQRKLAGPFADAAPFTVHRVAELFLSYHESGYSLTTVYSAQKWLSALLRAFAVSSSESSYSSTMGSDESSASVNHTATATVERPLISEDEYKQHNLPTNVRFTRIGWGVKEGAESSRATDSEEPAAKKAKPSAAEDADGSKLSGIISGSSEMEGADKSMGHGSFLKQENGDTLSSLPSKNSVSEESASISTVDTKCSADPISKSESPCDISLSGSRPLVISSLLVDESTGSGDSNIYPRVLYDARAINQEESTGSADASHRVLYDSRTINQNDQKYKEEIST